MDTTKVNISHVLNINVIEALQNILARSRVIIPNLETPYSNFPNTDQFAMRESHRQSISAIITERRQQLDSVFHEISGLETIMKSIKGLHQQLVEKRTKITQSMFLHQGVVSALWRLPTEVLSQIFCHCLPEFGHMSLPSRLKAPMLLTTICRRWREVAVDTSSLWCGLFVRVDDRDWERAASCYDTWLKQSRGRPLSLQYQCYAHDHSTKLRSLFQPYINQITSLFIHFSSTSNIRQYEHLLIDLPTLRELTIFGSDTPSNTPAIAYSIALSQDTLRGLRVLRAMFDLEHLAVPNPDIWFHLTNVEITIRGPFLHVLRLCPNLSSLTVRTTSYRVENLQPFTHTKLQSLRIPHWPVQVRNELYGVFEALSLPNLRVLEACIVRLWPHDGFSAFLERSNCPLQRLALGTGMTTDEQRAEYIALIPSLEIVVGDCHSRSDNLIFA